MPILQKILFALVLFLVWTVRKRGPSPHHIVDAWGYSNCKVIAALFERNWYLMYGEITSLAYIIQCRFNPLKQWHLQSVDFDSTQPPVMMRWWYTVVALMVRIDHKHSNDFKHQEIFPPSRLPFQFCTRLSWSISKANGPELYLPIATYCGHFLNWK